MAIVSFEQRGKVIQVTWKNGRCESFHYIWLRDNAPIADNLDPNTEERLVDFHTFPLVPRPSTISLDNSGNLVVAWRDLKSEVVYPANWLLTHAYSEEARADRASAIPSAEPWRFATKSEAPIFDHDTVINSGQTELSFLRAFRTFGLAFLEGAPTETGVVERLTRRLGYTREVAFGYIRDVRSEPAYDNVAFTSHRVPPHIDAVNYIWPYDVQFLHCIVNAAQGGDSWVVDGHAVAGRLRQDDPEAFDLLSRVKVDYKIGARSFDVRHAGPVLELDRDGILRIVRFSNQQRRILSVPHEQVEPFYRAYRIFSEMVNDPVNHLTFRFNPGDVMMFNNHRVMHARGAFDPQSGPRHLQLGTTDMDMVDSRIRILATDLQTDPQAVRPSAAAQ